MNTGTTTRSDFNSERDILIECAYHGMCFASTGECVRIPSQPDAPIPEKARLREYAVVEADGLVWVWPGDRDPTGTAPPKIPELADPGWESFKWHFEVASNATLMIENLLDTTHFYPLHSSTIGQPSDSTAQIAQLSIEEGFESGMPYVATIRESEAYPQTDAFADILGHSVADLYAKAVMTGPAGVHATRIAWPSGRRGDDHDPRKFKTVHLFTPLSTSRHTYRFVFLVPKGQRSGSDPSVSSLERAIPLLEGILPEDIGACEMQQEMFALPEDRYRAVTLRADKALRKALQALTAMQKEEESVSLL
jgi:vanillate O-demethylase monooxygenase subunit